MTDVADAVPATTAGAGQRRFRAFISYSHVDQTRGVRLARDLERYRLPRGLVGSRNHRGEVIERRLGLVFRDRDELGASTSLKADIARALERSDNLVVICSPSAAQSAYVGEEIRYFKRLGRSHRIFALIVDGVPNAGSRDRPELECFPAALLQDAAGQPSTDEPIAADARKTADGWRSARTKLIAGLLAIDLDRLRQRQRLRFIERCATAVVISIAVIGLLAYAADRARRADEQRRLQALESQAQQALGEIRRGRTTAGLGLALEAHRRLLEERAPLFPALARAIGQGLVEHRERKIVQRRNYYKWCVDGKWPAFMRLLEGKILDRSYRVRGSSCQAHAGNGDHAVLESIDGALTIVVLKGLGPERVVHLGERAVPGALAMSEDGRLVGVGTEGGALIIIDAELGRIRTRLVVGPSRVTHVAFGAGGRLMAAAYDDQILLWWIDDLSSFGRLSGHESEVLGIAFAPDGRSLASLGRDDTARLWDLTVGGLADSVEVDGSRRPTARGVLWPSLMDGLVSSDGQMVLRAERRTARLVERASGRELQVWPEHEKPIASLALSADGRLAATGADDGGARVWSTNTGALLRLVTFEDKVTGVTFDRTGQRLLAGSEDGTARIVEIATGDVKATIEARSGIRWADFAAGDAFVTFVAHGVFLADATTGRIVAEFAKRSEEGRPDRLLNVAAAVADDEVLALGWTNGVLELWDLPTRQLLAELQPGKITGLAVGGDASTLKVFRSDQEPLAWPIAGQFVDMVGRARERLPLKIKPVIDQGQE